MKMKLVIEALLIGFYTNIVYFLFYFPFTYLHLNLQIQIFIVGFFKHFLGYYTGIQTFYCNKLKTNTIALPKQLFMFSLLEGLSFVVLSIILFKNIELVWLKLFLTGLTIHLIADIIGVHTYFISNFCK